jgi:hypothetical protein
MSAVRRPHLSRRTSIILELIFFRRKPKIESKKDVISSSLVVAILRLADVTFLGDYGGSGLMLKTWFLEAIGVLHDCGVVQCEDVCLLKRDVRSWRWIRIWRIKIF